MASSRNRQDRHRRRHRLHRASSCCACSRSIRTASSRPSPRARKPGRAWPICFPTCAGASRSSSPTRRRRRSTDCDLVFFATPNGVAMERGARAGRRGRAHHRHRGGLPHQGRGAVGEVVRHEARLPRAGGRSGVRPAGSEPRADQGSARRRQSRLLPDGGAARLSAAPREPASSISITSSRTPNPASPARAAGPKSTRCSPRPRTTSRPTACPAIATIPRSRRDSRARRAAR